MALTRQQIIDLINQYIYTNGYQRITGSQLNQILVAVANAFEMQGGGTASGIDAVLEEGSAVGDGREITNAHGGKVSLAASKTYNDYVFEYVGFDTSATQYEGTAAVGIATSIVGNIKRTGTRSFEDMVNEDNLLPGEIFATTQYVAIGPTDGMSIEAASESIDGVYTVVISEAGRNTHTVAPDRIEHKLVHEEGTIHMKAIFDASTLTAISNDEYYSEQVNSAGSVSVNVYGGAQQAESRITYSYIEESISEGPQTSNHYQGKERILDSVENAVSKFSSALDAQSQYWIDNVGTTAVTVNKTGLKLHGSKKLSLTTGGSAASAGIATLVAGVFTVNTTAVQANSVISLTVQGAGTYTGNIRVQNLVAGTRFDIKSSESADNCTVFWQIIDL